MGPISKKQDSQLMQRLSASSPIHLCGLLPILPKSYNLLALTIGAQHSGVVHVADCSRTAWAPFDRRVRFPHKSKEAVVVLNTCCNFHLE